MIPIFTVQYFHNMWVIVALISLAAAAHQAWSANIFTTASDMFPKKAVSSIIGIGGMAGSVGGIIFQPLVGWILDYFTRIKSATLGYNFIFMICGVPICRVVADASFCPEDDAGAAGLAIAPGHRGSGAGDQGLGFWLEARMASSVLSTRVSNLVVGCFASINWISSSMATWPISKAGWRMQVSAGWKISVTGELVKPTMPISSGTFTFFRARAARQPVDNLSLAVTMASGRSFKCQQGFQSLFRFAYDQASIPAIFHERFIEGDVVIREGGFVAGESFLGDRQMLGDGQVGDPAETRLDEVFRGLISALEIVGDDLMRRHFFADPVKEDDGQPFVMELFQVGEVGSFGGQGDQKPVYGAGREVLGIGDFAFEGLVALGDYDVIAFFIGNGFDAVDDLGKEIVGDLADDDADGAATFFFQALCDGVRAIVETFGIFQHQFSGFRADLIAVPEGPGNGRGGEAQGFGNVFYRYGFEFHGIPH